MTSGLKGPHSRSFYSLDVLVARSTGGRRYVVPFRSPTERAEAIIKLTEGRASDNQDDRREGSSRR